MIDFIKQPEGDLDVEANHNYDLSRVAANIDSSYSENNKKMTQYHLKQLLKFNPKPVIFEIGVDAQHHANNKELSSTRAILEIKPDDAIYIGVDLHDKSHLNNPEKNIFTLQSASEDYNKVLAFLKERGINHIDYYFIDGWHSIKQCILEWEYTKMLSKDGIVAIHDTNYHLGPKYLMESLNPDLWTTANYPGEEWKDFGIGFVWRKGNEKFTKYVQD